MQYFGEHCRHLDFFDMVRTEDERELARRYDEVNSLLLLLKKKKTWLFNIGFGFQVHIDTKSATSMFECLRKKLTHTPAYAHFLSLLQHALLLPRTSHIHILSINLFKGPVILWIPNVMWWLFCDFIAELVDYGSHPHHWLMFDRVVQQLVLQGETNEDVDVKPLEINVKEIVQL